MGWDGVAGTMRLGGKLRIMGGALTPDIPVPRPAPRDGRGGHVSKLTRVVYAVVSGQ